jgi:hypothetical protein
MNTLYNVVRDALPNSPVDDQGLMDIARSLVTGFPTDLNRLRFIGFRSASISASTGFTLATNEIAILTNLLTTQNFSINGGAASTSSQMFGLVFNRFTAGTSSMYIQYALFTYQ